MLKKHLEFIFFLILFGIMYFTLMNSYMPIVIIKKINFNYILLEKYFYLRIVFLINNIVLLM
jgi:hypothetical protein